MQLDPVQRPDEALHVAGEVQLDLTLRLARIRIAAGRAKVGQGQHPPGPLAQARAGIVEIGARIVDAHVGVGAVLGARVTRLRGRARHAVAGVFAAHGGHGAHHVDRIEPGPRIERRRRRRHAGRWGDDAAGEAGPVDRLGEDRAGAVAHGELDVVGLARPDPELLDRHRLHRLAVGRDDGHRDAGTAHVEEGRRRRAHEPQANPLAGGGYARPIPGRRRSVHQVGVGGGRDVAVVRRVHPRPVPHPPPRQGLARPQAAHIIEEVSGGRLREIVVAAQLLEVREDLQRRFVRPVAQQDGVVPIGRRSGRRARLDDDRAIKPGLLGQGVRVIPVGARLTQLEAIGEGLAGRDPGKADARHAVHLGGQDDPVPVDAGHLLEAVADAQGDGVALAQSQHGGGHGAVHRRGDPTLAGEVDRQFGDLEIEFGPAQFGGRGGGGARQQRRRNSGHRPADRQALDEAAPCGRQGRTVEHGLLAVRRGGD